MQETFSHNSLYFDSFFLILFYFLAFKMICFVICIACGVIPLYFWLNIGKKETMLIKSHTDTYSQRKENFI